MAIAVFRFYAELNDFLKPQFRYRAFEHRFSTSQSVKDIIESLGVPHTEVDLVLINSRVSSLSDKLNDGDKVSVYPVFETLDIGMLKKDTQALRNLKFIADVHLGKLTRKLRLLGFDVLYSNTYNDREIVEIATRENRVVLTRDKGILKFGKLQKGYYIRSDNPEEQVKEVLGRFDLYRSIKPLSRCPLCNSNIVPIEKENILKRLKPKVKRFHNEFYICKTCNQIYWKGTHYEKILTWIQKLKNEQH